MLNHSKTLEQELNVSHTVCLGSIDPFEIVNYYIKWFTTSWTNSINQSAYLVHRLFNILEQ